MSLFEVNASNFQQEVLNASQPVLVDFWATWCGPCRMMAPTLATFAAEHKDEVKVVSCNVDDESELAGRYGISSIPTLMLFRGGTVTSTSVGVVPKSKLEHMLVGR